MFKIGDLLIYPGHGICRVDNISEKTYAGITKKYYELRPIENNRQLTINTPVDNEKVDLMKLIDHEEAESILKSFYLDGVKWIEKPQLRQKVYKDILKSGDRTEIAKVANTLIRKKYELEKDGRKFYQIEGRILNDIQDVLFKELALALNKSYKEIHEKIDRMIAS